MDPISLVSSSINLIKTILEISSQVQANLKSSQNISQRCQIILPSLISLQSQNNIPSNYSQPLKSLEKLLKEIEEFLKQFKKPTNSNFDKISWYAKLVKKRESHLKSFQDLNDRITQSIHDLNLGLLVNVNVNREKDCEDIREDFEDISQQLISLKSEINSTDRQKQNEIQQLQIQCNEMIGNWDVLKNEIKELQDKLNFITNHLTNQNSFSNRNNNNINNNNNNVGENEIKTELIQLKRLIEDINLNDHQSPQLMLLVDELNESFIETINQSNQSIKEIFVDEFNKLKQTFGEFHQDLIDSSKQELYQIYSSLQRMEISKEDEILRKKKLKDLKLFPRDIIFEENCELLGRGSFGEVKLGKYKNRLFAIKIIESRSSSGSFSDNEKKSIENEVILMSLCHDPYILSIFGYCELNQRTTYLVLELATVGSLWCLLENHEKYSNFPLSLQVAWMSDIFSALCYLHKHRIIHGDVKCENVLISEGLNCKLTDFGLSKHQLQSSFGVSSTTTIRGGGGSMAFMSPELMNQGKQSHRSDVFAGGITIYQIISRSSPSVRDRSRKIPSYLSVLNEPLLRNIIMKCLEENPKNRISSRECFDDICKVLNNESMRGDPRNNRRSLDFNETQQIIIQSITNYNHSTTTNLTATINENNNNSNSNNSSNSNNNNSASESMGSNSSQTKKLTKPLNTLTINEVAALLNTLNLGKFVDAFKENEVDGRTLLMCKNENDIIELGVSIQSKARVLYATIQTYKIEGVPLADINQETIVSENLSNLSSLTTSISTLNNNNNNENNNNNNNTDDYYSNLYLKCKCGDLNSFNDLESQSRIEVENIVCLGYLMIILNGNVDTPNNIPKDKERAKSIGREIITKLKEKEISSSLNHHEEFILGAMYDYGIEVNKDYEEAVKWYKLSADQGNSYAQNSLGVCYQNGEGVNKDYEEAVKWFKLSSDQGNSDAQYNLGICYKTSKGVNKDYEEAVKWYKLSSDQGNSYAQYNLGVCYYNGEGVNKDYEEAVKWYKLSADQGNSDAQNNLGVCYQNGEGVNKDYEEAVKWFKLSSNQGYSDAQYNLGICYYNGEGVNKDYEEAVKWYKLSADQGNSDAQYNLGVCYYNGEGVNKDYEEAVKWYRLSADQGNSDAQNALNQLNN